jgi:SAM-dependent methyltransferase
VTRATSESFDQAYYRDVCGVEQTRFDRARDDRVVRLVERHAPRPGPESALLDIGCGYGHLLRRFDHRYRLAGIDVSPHAAGVVRTAIPGAVVVTADVQRSLPFDHPFDVVLAINVVEHLADPSAGIRSIREALVPGGLCVIHLPTINGPLSRLIYRYAYAKDPTHVFRPAGREVLGLFRALGFRVLEASFAPHRWWLGSGVGWHPALLAALVRI